MGTLETNKTRQPGDTMLEPWPHFNVTQIQSFHNKAWTIAAAILRNSSAPRAACPSILVQAFTTPRISGRHPAPTSKNSSLPKSTSADWIKCTISWPQKTISSASGLTTSLTATIFFVPIFLAWPRTRSQTIQRTHGRLDGFTATLPYNPAI